MDKCLNIDDIAESLKVKKSTVMQWVKDGKFPPTIKLDDHILLWSLFVIEDWVGQQQITNDWLNNQDIDF
jgi:predicted DNA-binding transcriptional regulator AlpA